MQHNICDVTTYEILTTKNDSRDKVLKTYLKKLEFEN